MNWREATEEQLVMKALNAAPDERYMVEAVRDLVMVALRADSDDQKMDMLRALAFTVSFAIGTQDPKHWHELVNLVMKEVKADLMKVYKSMVKLREEKQ